MRNRTWSSYWSHVDSLRDRSQHSMGTLCILSLILHCALMAHGEDTTVVNLSKELEALNKSARQELSARGKEKSILRYGFHKTDLCMDYERAFLCVRKCLDIGYDVAYSDKRCKCTCYRKKEKAKFTPSGRPNRTKYREGTPSTKLPAWAQPPTPEPPKSLSDKHVADDESVDNKGTDNEEKGDNEEENNEDAPEGDENDNNGTQDDEEPEGDNSTDAGGEGEGEEQDGEGGEGEGGNSTDVGGDGDGAKQEGEGDAPPAEGGEGGDAPPAEGEDAPPAEGEDAPPAEGGDAPAEK